jgi:signal transduction histidine kinase
MREAPILNDARSPWWQYVMAALTVAAMLWFRQWLGNYPVDRVPFLTFGVGCVFTMLYAGMGPTLLNAALGILCGAYFFCEPIDSIRISIPTDQARTATFLVLAPVLTVLLDSMRRAQRRAQQHAAESQRKQEDLEREMTQRRLVENELRVQQSLLKQIFLVQEYDRRTAAYEVHDGIIQYITGALLHLERFSHQQKLGQKPPDDGLIQCSEALLRKTVEEGRRLMNGLRPPILDEQGPVAAIEHLICERREVSPEVDFQARVSFERLAPPLETTLYRITQEALTNATRHSGSDRIKIELWHENSVIHLEIRDWGRGFNPGQISEERVGLHGIRKRAELMTGKLAIESTPGQGTRIAVDLPLLLPEQWAENLSE